MTNAKKIIRHRLLLPYSKLYSVSDNRRDRHDRIRIKIAHRGYLLTEVVPTWIAAVKLYLSL